MIFIYIVISIFWLVSPILYCEYVYTPYQNEWWALPSLILVFIAWLVTLHKVMTKGKTDIMEVIF